MNQFDAAFPELLQRFMDETALDKADIMTITGVTKRQVDNWLSGKRGISGAKLYSLIMYTELNDIASNCYGYLVPAPDLLMEILGVDEDGNEMVEEPVETPPAVTMSLDEFKAAMGAG